MKKLKNWAIRTFGLKGSWHWAKKQMMKGHMVRCKHWTGALKYRVSPEMVPDEFGRNPIPSTLLQCTFHRTKDPLFEGDSIWETSNHHLSYEDNTDYVIFEWD